MPKERLVKVARASFWRRVVWLGRLRRRRKGRDRTALLVSWWDGRGVGGRTEEGGEAVDCCGGVGEGI